MTFTKRRTSPSDFTLVPPGTTLTIPQDAGLASFEWWCTDIVTEGKIDIHVQTNQGHTVEEISENVMNTLSPFDATVQVDVSWKCRLTTGDCSPETVFGKAQRRSSPVVQNWGGGVANRSGEAIRWRS